jgi:hypothetical protein
MLLTMPVPAIRQFARHPGNDQRQRPGQLAGGGNQFVHASCEGKKRLPDEPGAE